MSESRKRFISMNPEKAKENSSKGGKLGSKSRWNKAQVI
jgi:hypothetical protein